MRRGEIWTIAGGGDYTAKPRPAVVLQDNRFDAIDSVTVCLLTTDRTEAPLLRIPVEPDELNGLDAPSRIMVDKITTVRRSRLGMLMGRLGDEDIVRLNRALLVFLGFTT